MITNMLWKFFSQGYKYECEIQKTRKMEGISLNEAKKESCCWRCARGEDCMLIWNADLEWSGILIWKHDLEWSACWFHGFWNCVNSEWQNIPFFKKKIFFHLFLAVLGFHCCTGFSVVVETKSYSPVVVCGPLLLWALGSRVHGLQKLWHVGSLVTAPGL